MTIQMITPEPIDIDAVIAAIDAALEDGARVFASDMSKVTATWLNESKPTWTKDGPKTEGGNRVLEMKTDSTPFVWVNEGTKGPYPIPKAGPHPTGLGPFQPGYVRKTAPRTFGSGPGGRFGAFIKPKRVIHQGIEPGEFDATSAELLNDKMPAFAWTRLNAVASL